MRVLTNTLYLYRGGDADVDTKTEISAAYKLRLARPHGTGGGQRSHRSLELFLKLTPEGGARSTSESTRIFFLSASSLLCRAQGAMGSFFLFFCSPEIFGALKYSEKRNDTQKNLLVEYSEVRK